MTTSEPPKETVWGSMARTEAKAHKVVQELIDGEHE
jgi:hypothetical protein